MKESRYVFADVLEIVFRQETEEITMLNGVRKPDPAWRHVDLNDHIHAWIDGKLPTLESVVVGKEWVGEGADGCEVDVTEHRCRICNDRVVPQYTVSYAPEYEKGPPSYGLRVRPSLLTGGEWRIPEEDVSKLVEIFQRIFDPK